MADRFIDAFDASVAMLAQFPQMGVVRNFSNPALANLRMWFVQGFQKYLIFYMVREDAIEVFRLLHSSRDLETALGEDNP